MKKVSLCLILKNDCHKTIYSFERSGFKIIEKKSEFIIKDAPKEYIKVIDNVEIELLVAYSDTTDKRLIDYFTPIASQIIYVENKDGIVGSTSDAQMYNNLLSIASNEFICLFKPIVFFQTHWLTELIYYYETVGKSGIISIPSSFSDVEFLPLSTPDNECFVNVFIPKEKIIKPNNTLFFLKEYLFVVGALDESVLFTDGDELIQLQLRYIALGYINYYIPNQSCLIIDNQKTFSVNASISKSNISTTLADMKKVKSYYIPLKNI